VRVAGASVSLCSRRPRARRLAPSQAAADEATLLAGSRARRRGKRSRAEATWAALQRDPPLAPARSCAGERHPWHRCAGKCRPEQPCASGWRKKKEREKKRENDRWTPLARFLIPLLKNEKHKTGSSCP
jgi:hypothetical protein